MISKRMTRIVLVVVLVALMQVSCVAPSGDVSQSAASRPFTREVIPSELISFLPGATLTSVTWDKGVKPDDEIDREPEYKGDPIYGVFQLQKTGLNLRHGDEVLNQVERTRGVFAHGIEKIRLSLTHGTDDAAAQGLGISLDSSRDSAQFARDGGGKLVLRSFNQSRWRNITQDDYGALTVARRRQDRG